MESARPEEEATRQEGFRLPPREESSRAFRVGPIFIAKSSQQVLLFSAGTKNNQREGQASAYENKPVGSGERARDHGQGEPQVKRVPHPAVRTACHQGVLLPGHYGIGQILTQAAESPDEQESRGCPYGHADPA